ncbi:MAG: metal ABC transporter permease, partial [Phycisphaerae bacterium]
MNEFLQTLAQYAFLQRSVAAGAMAGVACGLVGSFVVVRRITYVAGGIAHCVLGGIGAAVYLRTVQGWDWLDPLYGALVAALAAAALIGLVSIRYRQREDTLISALWATGMAVGVLFMRATPGYAQGLMTYLFGSVLMVSSGDLWLIGGLTGVILLATVVFYRPLLAVCFDEEHARTRGIRAEVYYMLLLGLTALTVVLLAKVVGIILVIALLTLPVAVAGHFSRHLWQMMLLAAGLSVALTFGGQALSYVYNLPTGAVIIVLSAIVYTASFVGHRVRAHLRHRRKSR